MELKEAKQLPNSVERNLVTQPDRNNSKKRGIYNILFPPSEEIADTSIDSKYSNNNHEKPKFGNVATLDWLKTWRSTEIS